MFESEKEEVLKLFILFVVDWKEEGLKVVNDLL